MFEADEGGHAFLLIRRAVFLLPRDVLGISQQELIWNSICSISGSPVQGLQSEPTHLVQEIYGRFGSFDSLHLQYLSTLLSPNARYLHYKTCWFRRILKTKPTQQVLPPYFLLQMICNNVSWQEKDFGVKRWLSGLHFFSRLADLGLKQFSVAELFTRIFIPTSFLLACILHLHYFHDRFLQLTDLKAVTSKQDNTIYR